MPGMTLPSIIRRRGFGDDAVDHQDGGRRNQRRERTAGCNAGHQRPPWAVRHRPMASYRSNGATAGLLTGAGHPQGLVGARHAAVGGRRQARWPAVATLRWRPSRTACTAISRPASKMRISSAHLCTFAPPARAGGSRRDAVEVAADRAHALVRDASFQLQHGPVRSGWQRLEHRAPSAKASLTTRRVVA